MNPYRRHLLQMAFAAIGVLVLMVVATLVIDPYRVFGLTKLNRKNFSPNTRYLQIEHLKQHPAECLIMGTSRVNYYTVADVSRLTGLRAYNLTCPGGTLRETKMQLQWLLGRQKPKLVILGLDYDIQFLPPPPQGPYLRKWSHPEVSGTPLWEFRLEYLKFDVESTWLAVKRNFLEWKTTWTFDEETGQYAMPKRDDEMRDNWPAYEAAQFTPMPKRRQKANPEHEADLREIVTLLAQNGIQAQYIIHPVHLLNMASFDAADFAAWKARMQAICGTVHDFSADPALVGENRLFYEPVHFTAKAGRMVMEAVLGGKTPVR
jgi:hypothetical protein